MSADGGERIIVLTLDEGSILRRTPEVEHERAVAIADLLDANLFSPIGVEAGPYAVHLRIAENRLYFEIGSEKLPENCQVTLPLAPFRGIIRDYFLVCESYFEAIKHASASRIEAIDMGRRGLHNEAGEKLQSLLEEKIRLDFETARRLFTLICVLHIK